jgi:hypothetical protein
MGPPGDLPGFIEERLRGYLSRDRTGIRHALLSLFVASRTLTIPLVYRELSDGYPASYHSVASMVGMLASRIGILRVRRIEGGTASVYELREQYLDLVTRVMTAG